MCCSMHYYTNKCSWTYLLLHRLELFIIGQQVDQDRALTGTVERQVRVATCHVRQTEMNIKLALQAILKKTRALEDETDLADHPVASRCL